MNLLNKRLKTRTKGWNKCLIKKLFLALLSAFSCVFAIITAKDTKVYAMDVKWFEISTLDSS